MQAGGKFPADFSKYKIVKKENMAFCLFDIVETPRTAGLSEYDGMLTVAYTIMQVSNINSRYILYYYLALDNGKQLKPLYKGLRKTISVDTFQSVKIPVPPIEEQNQIVSYLDEQVKKINSAIVNKQEQIKKLQELKTRLISDAVTGKIDVRSIKIPDYEYVEEETENNMVETENEDTAEQEE